ncbi:hypothetical protein [Kytococcus sedentarius]|uniref:hypothetical protein n=1 Tax=Kytococcus sedentarius TaxID=1276 RepID=UPI0035BC695F
MSHPDASELTVLVIADPGMATRRAQAVREKLERSLERIYQQPVSVQVESQLLLVDQANALDIETAQRIASRHEGLDAVMLLTEMPRYVDNRPLVAGLFPEQQVGVVSLPTLGVWMSADRVLRVMASSIVRLVEVPGGESRAVRYPRNLSGARWSRRENGGYSLSSTAWAGPLRMVLGMVVSNEPWRTAPQLSTAFAAAMATGAFGIFYSSIWQMSDALSAYRLIFTAVVAVTTMVLWLVVRNRLWDPPEADRSPGLTFLYNLSTGVTLTLCVMALYGLLALLILVASLIVIAPEFMSDVLGYPAGFPNYLKIAWFSAAMGVVAGALGTSFDDETELRSLTHGQRQRQRFHSADHVEHGGAPPEEDPGPRGA